LFGVELDIRTLAFIAMLSSIVQAVAFCSLSLVSGRGRGTAIWAAGGIASAVGFVLLGYRAVIPDFASIVVANTLIVVAHACYFQGLQIYTKRKPNYWLSGTIVSIQAMLFVYFSAIAPDVNARIIVLSIALAALSMAGAFIVANPNRAQRTAPETAMAVTFALHGLFHLIRGVATWVAGENITDFMAASTIHAAAFLDIILFLMITAVGFTSMIIISLNSSLRAEAKAKNRLFTVLAHDLRAPFGGLSGLSLHAQQDLVAGNPAQALGNIRQLHSSTSETLRFLDDLLIWGRTLFDDGKAERSLISLDELIENTTKVIRPLTDAKSITIIHQPQNLIGHGISPHAEMVCRNLLVNAIKFSNPRSTITVTTEKVGDKIHTCIIDRGVGVSDDMIAQFSAANTSYASTDGTSGETGSGVGLSLCRDLCWEDGENIWLEHNPDGGLIATFTLTASQANQEAA
jgi:signal transduction histidine kinase